MKVYKCTGLKSNDDFIPFNELKFKQKKKIMKSRDEKMFRLDGKLYYPVWEEYEAPNVYSVREKGNWEKPKK